MRPAFIICIAGFSLLVGCARPASVDNAGQPAPAIQHSNHIVTIVGIPKYYVSGIPSGVRWAQIYGDTNGVDGLVADGVVLEIIRPKQFEGKIYTMHDDAHLADHYFLLGSRYELRVGVEDIGKFSFGPCTVVPFRKLTPDEK
jgi:hypothetical protein